MTDTREYNEENERTNDAMDAGATGNADGPPVDGGVVGGVPGRASVPGATDAANDAGGEDPPEEMGK